MTISVVLIIPTHEQWGIFPFLCVFYFRVVKFHSFHYKIPFTSFIRFIRYFILFSMVVNETLLLIYLSSDTLFAFSNATDFCVLLCILLLLQTFVFVESFDFSKHIIMSSADSGSFTSIFPMWVPLWYFIWKMKKDFNQQENWNGLQELIQRD